MTALHLNTTVNGSSGTCREAADVLRSIGAYAKGAADDVHEARNDAKAGWHGPASYAFLDATAGPSQNCDDLSFTSETYADALDTFADALDGVIKRMDQALGKATAGQLEVHGPFIMRPKHPGPAPEVGIGPVSPRDSPDVIYLFEKAQERYAEAAADFDRKAAVYNECLAIVKDARIREEQAHTDLREALAAEGDFDAWKVGRTSAAAVVSYVGTAENARYAAFIKAERLGEKAAGFQAMAEGRPGIYTAKQLAELKVAAMKAGAGRQTYLKRVEEFERLAKYAPEWLRKSAPKYPGRSESVHVPDAGASASKRAASAVVKRLPYIGSGLTVFSEGLGAYKGEQTWGKAVVSTGAVLAAGGTAGWAGATVGSAFGPVGMVVGGVVGGSIGGIAGGAVVDYFYPDDMPMPDAVDPIEYRGMGR